MQTDVIAEAGVNHNGSIQRAKEMIDVASECGATAVKFQSYRTDRLLSRQTPKAEYQKERTGDEDQYTMLEQYELTPSEQLELKGCAEDRSIEFMASPFDKESLGFLVEDVGVERIKVPSGEITNGPLLRDIARTKFPIILSTGASHTGEIREALAVIAYGRSNEGSPESLESIMNWFDRESGYEALKERTTLLHCVSSYPAEPDQVNLRAMDVLEDEFGLEVGFSDHTEGIFVPVLAVARGAQIIEKHFTLDRTLPGPDHQASLEPDELNEMIDRIKRVESVLGDSRKEPVDGEHKNRAIIRKSLFAEETIPEGTVFTEENLSAKRPGDGCSPMKYWSLLGTKSTGNYEKGDRIDE